MRRRSPIRPRNVALKMAIFADGRKQKEIAAAARVSEGDLSDEVNGRGELPPEAQQRIARVLKKPVEKLFKRRLALAV